jgi:23S rRNA (pseudouridine1915-N3)-methyltransferase
MRIHLISVGNRMPGWVRQAYGEYARRMPQECQLVLRETSLAKRHPNAEVARLVEEEGRRMLAAIPRGATVVALDLSGKHWTTPELCAALSRWLGSGRDTALLIGGPDGLSPACLQRADEVWALSKLTFPHPLVRVIIAEQLYRALSLLRNHPYHR